jgi:N6-adenosine-specific RNA methylase IME4
MKQYKLIVIDPPWNLKKLTHSARPNQVGFDYKTMSLDQIKSLPIPDLSDDSCLVFLWTIQKYLFDSKDILNHWGFTYLLTMVWEKTYGKSAGMPLYGFRWNAEFIAVGYNKKPPLWPTGALTPAVFQAENIRHSEKPQKFYTMIEHFGSPRLDMFARKKRDGWDVWGDEVESDIEI